MAESTAAAAPSSGPGGKGSSSSGTWWKSLASRKKPKEAPAAAPPGAPRPPPDPSEPPPFTAPSPADSLENQQQPSLGSGSRRNLKVSRSGRFKEKRKVRVPLLPQSPQQLFEGGGSAPPALSGEPETTPCP